MKYIALLTTLVFTLLMIASTNAAESIMFEDKRTDITGDANTNNLESEQQREYCKKLYRKYQSLKGKPQRRSAAHERYKAECLSQDR